MLKRCRTGRSSDFLPFQSLPAYNVQWRLEYFETSAEFHSSGTVRDSHPIPFYCRSVNAEKQTDSLQMYEKYLFLYAFIRFLSSSIFYFPFYQSPDSSVGRMNGVLGTYIALFYHEKQQAKDAGKCQPAVQLFHGNHKCLLL